MVSYKNYVILQEKRKKRRKHKLCTNNKGIYGVPLYWGGYPIGGPVTSDAGAGEGGEG